MKPSALKEKSKAFALRIIKLVEYVQSTKREFVLTKQILRSGTSVGANVHEAFWAQSQRDFVAKLYIARKECGETSYWLELFRDSEKITQEQFNSIYADNEEIGKLLTSSILTIEENIRMKKQNRAEEPSVEYGAPNDSLDTLLKALNNS